MVALLAQLLVVAAPPAPAEVSLSALRQRRPVHVVVDSDQPGVRLWRVPFERRMSQAEPQSPLCEAPCELDINVERALFFVDGPVTPESPPFPVSEPLPALRFEVHSGDLRLDRLGWAVGLCGAGAMIVGLDGLLLGSPSLALTFAITVGVGILFELFGVGLQHWARTTVQVEDAAPWSAEPTSL